MFVEQTFFSSGELWAIGTDALATPVKFGTLQAVSLDFSFTEKSLQGQRLFAEKINRSAGKITGKATYGRINPQLANALFFNGIIATGRELVASGETATIPSATPWTVVVGNAAKFVADLGVTYAVTGNDFEKVAAAPTVGQYSVNAATGTYTFATADAGQAIAISYSYTDTGGHTLSVTNAVAGLNPAFQIILREEDDSGAFGVKLYACTSNKLALATKMGDFLIPEFDFSAAADAASRVVDFWTE